MNLVLFADKQVGLEVTEFLISKYSEDLSLVVTMADNEIARLAREAKVSYYIYDSSDNLYSHISKFGVLLDLGILAWWPKIIEPNILRLPEDGFINFHPSLLPHNRGKHYNFWAIVERAPFGVTLHFADKDVDSGDLICQKNIVYDWTDTGGTLYHRAQKEIVELFCTNYPTLRTRKIPRQKQDLQLGSFHCASELEEASQINLDKNYSARYLFDLVRARTFEGYPACWFEAEGKKYEVRVQIKER